MCIIRVLGVMACNDCDVGAVISICAPLCLALAFVLSSLIGDISMTLSLVSPVAYKLYSGLKRTHLLLYLLTYLLTW